MDRVGEVRRRGKHDGRGRIDRFDGAVRRFQQAIEISRVAGPCPPGSGLPRQKVRLVPHNPGGDAAFIGTRQSQHELTEDVAGIVDGVLQASRHAGCAVVPVAIRPAGRALHDADDRDAGGERWLQASLIEVAIQRPVARAVGLNELPQEERAIPGSPGLTSRRGLAAGIDDTQHGRRRIPAVGRGGRRATAENQRDQRQGKQQAAHRPHSVGKTAMPPPT